MISVIIPAMNEEQVIGSVVAQVRQVLDKYGEDYEVIVIDDGSSDNTGIAATEAGAKLVRHSYNMGNGAAVKAGIRQARGDVIVMLDGDGQHDPKDILRLLAPIDHYGMVVGARTKDSHTAWYRDIANKIYNLLASYICGTHIPDLTSGFRAIHTSLAKQFLYLLPNTFSYPTTLTLSVLRSGHCVNYVPIKVSKRVGKSKIKLLKDGSRFLVIIMRITTLFSPFKVFLPVSLLVFGTGLSWYLYSLIVQAPRFTNASVVMILAGIQFFIMGLISEQIAQLRYDRSEEPAFYSPDYKENSSNGNVFEEESISQSETIRQF
jgi:glycosyltransferase involved in cell wall biosynthesis